MQYQGKFGGFSLHSHKDCDVNMTIRKGDD